MTTTSGYAEWLARTPTDDRWESWQEEGRRRGFTDPWTPRQDAASDGQWGADERLADDGLPDVSAGRGGRDSAAGGSASDRPPFPEPEDRGSAASSPLGELEYVGDLIRPGRIHLWVGEEGVGKSLSVIGELAIRVAVAGGSYAGTWPVVRTGPVVYLSEMHPDDDFGYESKVLASLGLERSALAGRLYRLPLMSAARGTPPLMAADWRQWITGWLQEHGGLVLIIDTATAATAVDPWGRAMQDVYAGLRAMLDEYPALAIVLTLHFKKPQGRGDRRLSDVLGEWGRWADVVVLMENEAGRTKVRISTRKRVRQELEIVATKAGGLLVDPRTRMDARGPKVPPEAVLKAIEAEPGITYAQLGRLLRVSKDTAARYVRDLGDKVTVVAGGAPSGPGSTARVYATAASPQRDT